MYSNFSGLHAQPAISILGQRNTAAFWFYSNGFGGTYLCQFPSFHLEERCRSRAPVYAFCALPPAHNDFDTDAPFIQTETGLRRTGA
jgi:hypothetical protein